MINEPVAYKKYVNFDLDTIAVKQCFDSKSCDMAYRQLGKFLHKNGFEHHQGSGYISKTPISKFAIYNMIRKMRKELPWTINCVKSFVHTDIVDKLYEDLRLINPHKFKAQQKAKLHSVKNTRARRPGQGLEPKALSRSRGNSLQM